MYALRPYQAAAVSATWNDLCANPGNPVVVLPTGAGKSLVIAELARKAREHSGRVIVCQHRGELIQQNAEKLRALGVDCGIYSAGLRRFDTEADVICAGIQSVFRKAASFGSRQIIIIDEVHLVPTDGEGMYRTFLDDLRAINPKLRMIGLTATPFRLDCGDLCRPDGMFQRVSYEAQIGELIDCGYLSRVITAPVHGIDTSGLHIRQGEFIASEMESAFLPIVSAACREIAALTGDRHSILIFCCGVAHAEAVAEELRRLGENAEVITGNTSPLERQATLRRFRERRLKYLVNIDVLTTGFDAPCIDGIAVLRATQSAGLFAQIVGRGFRLFPGKENALILDFGENIDRHGPIDSKDYGRRKKKKTVGGDAPEKMCPNCENMSPLSATVCEECGFAFPRKIELRHGDTAADAALLEYDQPAEWFDVETVKYAEHRKRNAPEAPPTLRADYECRRESGNLTETISEWVCLEHIGFAGDKASFWWNVRSFAERPATVAGALEIAGSIGCPRRIQVKREGKFWRIVAADGIEKPEEWDVKRNEWQDQETPF